MVLLWTRLCFIGILLVLGGVDSTNKTQTNARQKRLFSIFNIVTFKNDPCTTTGNDNLGGTCMTSSECMAKSGSASGNCAAGFGVCCLFILKGACSSDQTVSQNCTYIRNSGYPSADTTVSSTCLYNFKRICPNLCQIRLDFKILSTVSAATGICGTTADAVTVSSPFSSTVNGLPPTVCGTLTGQHMYFETGSTGTAGSLSIAKGTDAGNRAYDIKVTYFTCDNLAKAPAGCTQYFTGSSGSFQSYNHAGDQLLTKQNYKNCFRQEEGFCRIELRESSITSPDPFELSAIAAMSMIICNAVSFITFSTPTNSMFCADFLNNAAIAQAFAVPVTSSPGAPFEVGVTTLATDLSGFSGFNLNYQQIPCA